MEWLRNLLVQRMNQSQGWVATWDTRSDRQRSRPFLHSSYRKKNEASFPAGPGGPACTGEPLQIPAAGIVLFPTERLSDNWWSLLLLMHRLALRAACKSFFSVENDSVKESSRYLSSDFFERNTEKRNLHVCFLYDLLCSRAVEGCCKIAMCFAHKER